MPPLALDSWQVAPFHSRAYDEWDRCLFLGGNVTIGDGSAASIVGCELRGAEVRTSLEALAAEALGEAVLVHVEQRVDAVRGRERHDAIDLVQVCRRRGWGRATRCVCAQRSASAHLLSPTSSKVRPKILRCAAGLRGRTCGPCSGDQA